MNAVTKSIAPLAELLGPSACLREAADIAPYSADWRSWQGALPEAVLRPSSVEQVSAIVRRCAEEKLAIVPAGGRTGLCGGAILPSNGPPAVMLSLERLNRIRMVDARDYSMVVDAGCVVEQVQRAAAEVGRLFPISWGAQGTAQVGGMLSTNTGGIRTLRWGNAREQVLGLEVVLPDGRVLDDLRRVRKDNSGYALRHLFIGAEGTLGIITGAALRLQPALRAVETAFVAVPNPEAALSLFGRVQDSGAEVIGFEILSRFCMEMVDRHGQNTRMPMALDSPWYVMVELAASHPSVPLRQMLEAALFEAMEHGEVTNAVLAESEEHRAAFWRIREHFPECARAEGPAISSDTAVPVSAVPEFIRRAQAVLAEKYPEGRVVALGHAGDGNIHLSLMAPPGVKRDEWFSRATGAEMLVNEIAVSLGGSFSAEHGIGQSKRHVMAEWKDKVALDVMRSLKQAIDPDGLMNPGKVLP